MTQINRLVLKGFKSFANHTELLFGSGFNCILGPNGSGKSNILDALTFVLGRQSSKSMRVEKAANLIYNGGKKGTPSKYAMVSIAFDNKNKTFPVEADEIVVSRAVKQNGNSVYRLNGKRAVRKDIIDLLSLARIDPDGYNIILQGDIIKFVEMSTVQKREVVEEIAGIGAYEEKKQKAMNELNHVDERINEANIILEERKTHLKELKKERDQAVQFKDLNDKLQTYKATLVKQEIDKKSEVTGRYSKEEKTYQEKIEKGNALIEEFKKKVEENKTEISELNKEIEKRGDKAQVQLNREIEQLKIDIATNKTKLDNFKSEIQRINNRKEGLNEDVKVTKDKIDRLDMEKKELNKELQQKEKDLQKIEKNIEDFKKKNQFDNNVDEIEKNIDRIEKETEDRQNEIQKLREEQQNALREKDKIELMINNIEDQIDKLAKVKKENQGQLKELKQHRERFKEISKKLTGFLNEDSSLSEKLVEAREQLNNVNQKLVKLRARNMSVMEQMAGDAAIRSIMDQKKQNKIKGIYGTVSELGQVDEKYSLALEIAAGARIKSIIVEDDKVAQNCINFLKSNQRGVATFLPLNKIKAPLIDASSRELSKKNGAHGMAIDLVEFDPKFNKAFAYVFSNTIVIDDIETARKLGIGTTRMITLDGDLVETSGAMRGGHRQKRKGVGFKEKEVQQEIKQYEATELKLEQTISSGLKRKSELDKFITELRQDKANTEGEIIKLEKTLHIKGEDADGFDSAKKKLLEDNEAIDKKIDEVQNNISNKNKDLAKLKINKQELRNKINELRKPEVLAELRAFEEKRNEIREAMIRLKSDIKNIEGQTNTILGPDVKKSFEIMKDIEKEEEKFKNILSTTKDTIKDQEKTLKDKEENAKVFYAKYKKLFTKRDSIEQDVYKTEAKMNQEQLKIKGVEERINDINLRVAATKAELAGLEKEFEQYVGVKILETKKPIDELRLSIREMEKKKMNIGNVNMRALEVYDNIEKEYSQLEDKKVKLNSEKEDVLKLIGEIEGKKKKIFMETLEIVNKHFVEFFKKLSKKGEAFLDLENKENPFEAGLDIKVRITGTKFLDIKSLSGGEKTLTALAFIFAIQEHEPASFYILDEVDAALDKHNSEKFAQMVRSYSGRAQYLIISHNDAIISEADKLYGISMGDHGRSNITTLQL